jgi:ABC-type uncharacterized transport system permease subunit
MLKLEARPEPSRLMSMLSPVLALALTVLIGLILFEVLGKDPVRGLQVFFVEPFRNGYAISELALKATPLVLIALGLAVCFRSNVWNIGAEGQYILGAVFAGGVAMQASADTPGAGSSWPSCWLACWAACSGPASSRCCATASTPTRSWSA